MRHARLRDAHDQRQVCPFGRVGGGSHVGEPRVTEQGRCPPGLVWVGGGGRAGRRAGQGRSAAEAASWLRPHGPNRLVSARKESASRPSCAMLLTALSLSHLASAPGPRPVRHHLRPGGPARADPAAPLRDRAAGHRGPHHYRPAPAGLPDHRAEPRPVVDLRQHRRRPRGHRRTHQAGHPTPPPPNYHRPS